MRYMLFILCIFTSIQVQAQTKPKTETAYDQNYPLDLEKMGIKLPETSSPELKRILNSENTIFYKLPQVWQHYVPASRIERNNLTLNTKSYYTTPMIFGVYYATFAPEFHANGNFPWETTIGLNSSHKNPENPYKTFNFVNLPGEEGDPKPILIVSEYPIKWIYPPETTVGEVIYITHEGKNYIQEIRTRKKFADCTSWSPGLYRPLRNKEEFEKVTGIKDFVAPKKYFHFRNPQETEVFTMSGLVERLPELSEDTVKEILAMPFKELEVNGEVWSPASDQSFSILPENYCFSLLMSVDSATCIDCHRQTQISVSNLTPKDPDVIKYPKKIGNIRGCDAVFSWHPFSEKGIQVSDLKVLKPAVRGYDTKNRIIAFEDDIDTSEYKMTKYVQDALKVYELPANKYLHEAESK